MAEQVSGNHYSSHQIQPWDLIDSYNLNYHEGAAIKYIARNREKNGIEDLQKAISELEREIQIRIRSSSLAPAAFHETPTKGKAPKYDCDPEF